MLNLLFALAVAVAPASPAAPAPKPAVNTLCPVLGGKVDANSPKVAVRGREYRICCMGCDTELKAHPDKYLKPDGTPKNAK
jgi:hypothetical protein